MKRFKIEERCNHVGERRCQIFGEVGKDIGPSVWYFVPEVWEVNVFKQFRRGIMCLSYFMEFSRFSSFV